MAGGLVTSITAFLSARLNGRKVNVSPDDPLPVTVVSGGGGSSTSLADSSVVDSANPPVYWLVRDNGTTLTYLNWATGATGTPTSPVTPVGKGTGRSVSTTSYTGVVAGTGYSVGDILQRIVVLDISTTTPTVIAAAWINTTTGLVMGTAPTMANLNPIDDNVSATIADGASATLGSKADAAATDSTSAWSNISLLKGVYARLTAVIAQLPASLGAKTGAQSLSVVPNTDTFWPIVGNVAGGVADGGNPLKMGGLVSTTVGGLTAYATGQRGNAALGTHGNNITTIGLANDGTTGVVAMLIGRGTNVDALPTTSTAGQIGVVGFTEVFNGTTWDRMRGDTGGIYLSGPVVGAVTETAPATDTASSGLNGRLQRIAQNISSLIALLPASLGIKTAAGSLSVAPASDASFALGASSAIIGAVYNIGSAWNDTSTALGSGATYTGTSRASTNQNAYSYFKTRAYADQSGTLYVDYSNDSGTTWQQLASQALTGPGAAQLVVELIGPTGSTILYRTRFVNGGTAQGVFRLVSCYANN